MRCRYDIAVMVLRVSNRLAPGFQNRSASFRQQVLSHWICRRFLLSIFLLYRLRSTCRERRKMQCDVVEEIRLKLVVARIPNASFGYRIVFCLSTICESIIIIVLQPTTYHQQHAATSISAIDNCQCDSLLS